MTKSRLVKSLVKIINTPNVFDTDIHNDIDELLVQTAHLGVSVNQRDKMIQLHQFIVDTHDGGIESTVELVNLVLDVITTLKPFPYKYTVKYWLKQVSMVDKSNYVALVCITRAALRAKLRWTTQQDLKLIGSWDVPGYFEVELLLVALYNLVLKETFDPSNPEDLRTLNSYITNLLEALKPRTLESL